MPDPIPLPIAPPPGVVITETGKVAAGRWTACDAVHFVRGQPQKIGGWVRSTHTPTSGQPRAAHAWRDNQANEFIAVGTFRKLYAYDTSLAQNDITPFRRTSSLGSNPIATQNGSAIVVISDTGHGAGVGDTLVI